MKEGGVYKKDRVFRERKGGGDEKRKKKKKEEHWEERVSSTIFVLTLASLS